MTTPWLLVDYGEVVSRPYDPASLAEIAALLGLAEDELATRYWAHRPAYDAGMAAGDYWPLVAGRPLDDATLARVDAVDLAGWARLDPDVLAWLADEHAGGRRLALLSNAPHVQADAFDRSPWLADFEHVFVSSRLGVVKPRPEVFDRVLAAMGAEPAEVTFVDDRAENVAAAAALGIRAIRYSGLADLRRRLG